MQYLSDNEITLLFREKNKFEQIPFNEFPIIKEPIDDGKSLCNIIVQICVTAFLTSCITQLHIYIPKLCVDSTLKDLSVHFKMITFTGKTDFFNVYILKDLRPNSTAEFEYIVKKGILHPILTECFENAPSYYFDVKNSTPEDYIYAKYLPNYNILNCHDSIEDDSLIQLFRKFNSNVLVGFPALFNENQINCNPYFNSYYNHGYDIFFCGAIKNGVFQSHSAILSLKNN